MPLHFSYIDPEEPSTIPARQVNGGLYTGTPFTAGAAWGNVPVVPNADVMVAQNLNTANPPPGAQLYVPGYTRPGNNTQAPAHASINCRP